MRSIQLTASTRYLAKESFLFAILSCVIILNGTTAGLTNIRQFTILAIVISLTGITWLVLGQHARNPLSRPLLIWCGVYLISLILSSDPRRSFSQSILMMTGIFLFSFVCDLVARGWPAELFTKVILIIGAIIIATGWMEAGLWYSTWLENFPGKWIPTMLYRPASANIIAGYLNVILLVAITRFFQSSSRSARWMLGLQIITCLPLVYFSSSRAGWLGLAAGLLCAALLHRATLLPHVTRWGIVLWKKKIIRWVGAGAIILFLALAGWVLVRQAAHPTHGNLFDSRSEFWGPAISAFQSSPLIGTGPFTYANSYLSATSVPPRYLFIHSHGTLFNLLAEMGILGLFAMGFLVFSVVRLLLENCRSSSGLNLSISTAALAGLTALGVQSLFDGFHAEPIALWSWIIVLGASAGQNTLVNRVPGRPYPALFLIAALWVEIWLISPLHTAVNLLDQQRLNDAIPGLQNAVKRDPSSVIAQQQYSLTLAQLGYSTSQEYLQNAQREAETLVKMESHWAINHVNLAALSSALGDLPRAKNELTLAVKLAPTCAICYLNLGVTAEKMKDATSAESAYSKFLLLSSDVSSAYFWRSSPLRIQVYKKWNTEHPFSLSTRSQLEQAVSANPNTVAPYVQLAEYHMENKNYQEAEKLLRLARFAYSELFYDPLERDWRLAELRFLQGDTIRAAESGAEVIKLYALQGLWGNGSFGRLYYAPLMFRRTAAAVELVPQVQLFPVTDRWAHRMNMVSTWYRSLGKESEADQMAMMAKLAAPDIQP